MIPICTFSQIEPLTQSFIYTSFNPYKNLPVSIFQTLVLDPIISEFVFLFSIVRAIYFKWAKSSTHGPCFWTSEKETGITISTTGLQQGLFVFFFQMFKKCLIISESHYYFLHLLFTKSKRKWVLLYSLSKYKGRKFHHSKFCWFYM
jgi:hypothetical protein